MLTVGMLVMALLGAATGCAQTACPAIGWINTVEVDASAFGPDVLVQFCVDAGCSAGPGEEPTPSSDMGAPLQNEDGVFSLSMTTPEQATIRVYDATGTLLHESDHDITWSHSTERCGGPSISDPVVLSP